MSRRKHTKQMSPKEREVLREAVDSLDITSWKHCGEHCIQRLVEKKLNLIEVLNAVKFGEIIEAHNKKEDDIRILLRQQTKRGSSVCVVISLRDGEIVTAYENKSKDKHFTIDWSEYKWKVDLVSEVKMFMNRRNRKRRGVKRLSNMHKGGDIHGLYNPRKTHPRKQSYASGNKDYR